MRKDPASVGVGQGPMYQLEVVATVVVEVEGDSSRQKEQAGERDCDAPRSI